MTYEVTINNDEYIVTPIVNNTSVEVLPTVNLTLSNANTYTRIEIDNKLDDKADLEHNHVISEVVNLQSALDSKQATLVSGTNVKTVNNESILGSGNITFQGNIDHNVLINRNIANQHSISAITDLQTTLDSKQSNLGFTPENVANKENTTIDTSTTKYPTVNLLKSGLDSKANISHTHTISNVTNLQSSLDGKQSTITGGASSVTSLNLTTNRALISDATGKIAVSPYTSAEELAYLDGVTSNIQTQLSGKQALLVSGSNIKTINNTSLLGSGNISVTADLSNVYTKTETNTLLSSKSDTTHNHNLNNLTEKSYNSLSDKPDLSSLHTHSNKTVLDNIVGNGDGSSFLANDGTYKTISGGSTDHSALSNRNIADQHTISSITGLQSALDGKQSVISLTADRVLISNGSGAVTNSSITTTELNYLDDVSANIQTQLNNKSATSHLHDDRYYTETEIDSMIGDIETLLAAL